MENEKLEVWNELLENLSACAVKKYQTSMEYSCWEQRLEQIRGYLTADLTDEQKMQVEEFLSEIIAAGECQQQILYKQGVMDGVWMLKQMGVV